MKYRQKIEDFIVEEIADHKILSNGQYKLYHIEKVGIETFALFNLISTRFHIPRSEIGIAGLKDTFAKTKQYMTIPKKYELKNIENFNVKFLGYLNNPLKIGDLIGNKFIITVREIEKSEMKYILENSKLTKYGLPNYFDSQRFGSVVNNQFIGKFLVKKDYEGAVKQYLTSISISDSDQRKLNKKNILSSWPTFHINIQDYDLKRIVFAYKNTKKWVVAYKHISPSLRQLFISAYQSYIWNECIKLLLQENIEQKELYSIRYAVDELIFNKNKISNFPHTFQTISHKIKPKDYEKNIIQKVLEKENTKIEEFNIRQTGNFFKTSDRKVMLYPKKLEIGDPIKEEQKYNIVCKFILSKGCYATMVLKKIFGQ